jgi:magnesium-transporting ATPase (P-type)
MGNVNNICTDKTGTLTKGQMVVESFWFKGRDYNANEFKNLSTQEKKLFFENICNNITVVETTDINGNLVLNGDMTEKALYNYMIENGYDKNNILNYDSENKDKEKYVLNFNSDNKFMCTLIRENAYNYKLYLKGAHEIVFPLLTTIRSGSTVYEWFEKYKEDVSKIIQKYSKQSKRTLIFASKKISVKEFNDSNKLYKEKNAEFFKSLYHNLNFEYLIGIRDQLRKEVSHSVEMCHKAGIKVRMVTGDNIITALAISKDSNIITEDQFNEAFEDVDKFRNICNNILRPKRNYSSNNILNKDPSNNISDKTLDEIAKMDFDSPIALEGEQFRLLSGNLTKNYDPKTHKIKNITLNDVEMF